MVEAVAVLTVIGVLVEATVVIQMVALETQVQVPLWLVAAGHKFLEDL